jgi:molecular chaperone GrpE
MAARDDKEGWFDDDPSTPPGGPPEPAEASSGDRPPEGEEEGGDADLGSTGGPDGPPADLDDIDVEAALLEEGLLYAEADASPGASAGDEAAEYRDALVRMKADFENYKKRVAKDHALTVERAAEKLVVELLPVLDACEAALGHGSTDVEPIYKSLLDTLEKGGLVRMSPEGQPFDPNLHEAVLHEEGDGGEIIVLESLRTGYSWGGRVLRPAMVKVQG